MEKNDTENKHYEFCCSGNCPIGFGSCYMEEYYDLASEIISNINADHQFSMPELVLRTAKKTGHLNDVELFDGLLDPKRLSFVVHSVDGGILTSEESSIFSRVLSQSLQFIQLAPKTFTPVYHIALWSTIKIKDVHCLKHLFSSTVKPLSIPSCVYQSLLLEAISTCSPDTVEILLLNGAKSNIPLRPAEKIQENIYRPITHCVNQFCELVQDHRSEKLDFILRCLFSASNESPFIANDKYGSDRAVLYRTAFLWQWSRETAIFLLEEGSNYLNMKDAEGQSPLDRQLWSIKSPQPGHSFEIVPWLERIDQMPRFFAKAFNFGIMPLLRSGCRCLEEFEMAFELCYISIYHQVKDWSVQIFGRKGTFLDVFIEARPSNTTSLKVWKLIRNAINDDDQEPLEALLGTFPLSLQKLSRRAILETLPLGYLSRRKAIQTLKLPPCLQNYLDFCDLSLTIDGEHLLCS